jgi:hypothetical protein
VRIALDGFTKSWDVFVRGVVAWEKLPDWQRLWDDFVQEEIILGQSGSSFSPHIVDEEGLALARKGKGKRRRKVERRRTLTFLKSNVFSVTRWDTLPHSVQRKKRRTNHRWQLLQQWMSFPKAWRNIFAS